MMPGHYREVGVKRVSFALTSDEIKRRLKGSKTYITTKYIVLHGEDGWAVAKVRKRRSPTLFCKVLGAEVISLPDNTVYCEKDDVDVHNKTMMARVAAQHEGKAVVVKGRFEHVSFIFKEPVLDIIIVDLVPPDSRLMQLADEVLRVIPFKRAVNLVPRMIDLEELGAKVRTGTVVFPCRASELESSKKVFFLDSVKDIPPEGLDDVTLVGCALSQRIFRSVFKREPANIGTCPKDFVPKDAPVLTRCCMAERPEVRGNAVVLPWGANADEVCFALRKLTA